MAFNVGSITAELELNGQQFIATLKNADDVLNAFSSSATNAAKESSGLFQSFIDFKGAIDLVADGFNLLKGAVNSVIGLFKQAIEASDAFEASVQSLDVALRLRGIGEMKEELVELGIQLESTTQFSRNTVIDVERLLTVFGVGSKDIPGFTEAVLNLSHAMGIDTVAAARLLGRSLSGSVGRLSQYIPEAKDLSDATLKMGGAFDLVNEKLGGFAKAAANTSEAIEKRFFNAITTTLQTFGDTISPILDVFFVAGRKVLQAFSEGIQANSGALNAFFAGFALKAVQLLQGLVDFIIDIPVHIARVKGSFGEFKVAVLTAFNEAQIRVQQFVLALAKLQLQIANSTIGKRLLGFGEAEQQEALVFFAEARIALGQSETEAKKYATSMQLAAADTAVLVTQAQAAADAVRDGADGTSVWASFIDNVRNSLGEANVALTDMVNGVEKVDTSFDGINESAGRLTARLKELRERTGTLAPKEELNRLHEGLTKAGKAAKETASAVGVVGNATDEAADGADRMAGSFDRAATSIRAAAHEFSETAGGFGEFGGGGGGSGSGGGLGTGGFHSGGTSGLATANAAQTAATLQGAIANARFGVGFQKKTNAFFIAQLTGVLRGQLQEELQGFVTGITDELSRAGIFDAAQRSAYIQQRFEEARRLGTLPRGATYNTSTGTIGGGYG